MAEDTKKTEAAPLPELPMPQINVRADLQQNTLLPRLRP